MKKFYLYICVINILCTVFTTSSCMLGDDYTPPEYYSDEEISRSLGSTSLKVADFRPFNPKDFNDETLNTLIEKALSSSPDLKLALAKLKTSRQNLRMKQVAILPTFDASGEYNYEKRGDNMGIAASEDDNYYALGIDAAWELDIFGGIRRQTEAAEALWQQQKESLKYTKVSLVAEVSITYISYRTTAELLEKAKENTLLQTNIYNIIKARYDSGLASKIDLTQAKYQLNTTKASIPELEYKKTVLENSLAILVGELPSALNYMLKQNSGNNLVTKDLTYDITEVYNLPLYVVRNRPDVKAAEQAIVAQNALVGAAIAQMFPSFSISAFLGMESLHFGNLFKSDSFSYSYTPQISTPLLHFGALWNNVKQQKAIKEEQVILYEQSILAAASDIKNALTAIDKESKRNQEMKSAYENIAQSAELTTDNYKSGLITYSEVLNAEQRRITAQNAMISSNGSIYQNMVLFYKAIGGEFALSPYTAPKNNNNITENGI